MKGLFPIIRYARWWVVFGVVVMAGGILLFLMNQRYSIQFTGGVEMTLDTITIPENATAAISKALTEKGLPPQHITFGKKDTFSSLLVQISLTDDAQVQQVTDLLKQTLLDQKIISSADNVLEQSIIGPSIGEYMKKSAIIALGWGIVLMAVYILFAFAAMRRLISPALLGVITILTMLFDIAFPAGMYGLWMMINPMVQIDAVFIIAILTVMGYSINDTIIIFDRVRENFITKEAQFFQGRANVADLFENSLRQTMRRSLGTSMTTFVVVVAMWVFGTGALKLFAFTFGMGVLSGSFSSIFFSATLAYLFSQKTLAKK